MIQYTGKPIHVTLWKHWPIHANRIGLHWIPENTVHGMIHIGMIWHDLVDAYSSAMVQIQSSVAMRHDTVNIIEKKKSKWVGSDLEDRVKIKGQCSMCLPHYYLYIRCAHPKPPYPHAARCARPTSNLSKPPFATKCVRPTSSLSVHFSRCARPTTDLYEYTPICYQMCPFNIQHTFYYPIVQSTS